MGRWGCLLVLVMACTQVAQAAPRAEYSHAHRVALQDTTATTQTPGSVPTVAIVQSTPVSVPTVSIPVPTATATPKPKPKKHPAKSGKKPVTTDSLPGTWIWAFLTSYCPGSAGWLSSSGNTVFYGMLANDYYRFGTRVYIPVIGLIGVVEDRFGGTSTWNHFDVWSGSCYSTPTGYFKVKVLG
jgi:hypothetical protein